MLEVLAEDYIRTANAKGVATRAMLLQHALKNAAVPIVTVIGIGVALLISGVVITETVFNIPGIGRLVVDAIARRDYPIIQGVILIFSAVYVLVNLAGRPLLHACSTRASATDVATATRIRRRDRAARAARGCARFARRNPTLVGGGAMSAVIALLAIAAPLIAGDAVTMQPAQRLRPPSAAYWLGTDHLGRDVFARTVYGARVSLLVGLAWRRCRSRSACSIGLLAGYFRRVDAVVMRLMDGLMAIPAILLAIALVALTRSSVRP